MSNLVGCSPIRLISTSALLPAGVTLQAIDGETMLSPTIMSQNFYSRNGYTYAASGAYNVAYANGWDSANFFPLGPWQGDFFQSSNVTTYTGLSWNVDYNNADVNFNFVNANGLYFVFQPGATVDGTMGNETVALLSADENYSNSLANIAATPLAVQNNRPWWIQNTVSILQVGSIAGTPMSTILSQPNPAPSSTTRHFDWCTADTYWFIQGHEESNGIGNTGPPCTGGDTGANLGSAYNLGRSATFAEQARGHPYGDAIDVYRQFLAGGGFPAPGFQLIETGEPGSAAGATTALFLIQPAELNQAVWMSIIHGARGIIYFDHSFTGPAFSHFNMENVYYQTSSNYPNYSGIFNPAGISMFQQVANTDLLVTNMAKILNSPFALGFATVSPAAYNFPFLPHGSSAIFTANSSGTTTLTVSSITGTIGRVGSFVTGTGIPAGTVIVVQLTGSPGLAGTYQTNVPTSLSSVAATAWSAFPLLPSDLSTFGIDIMTKWYQGGSFTNSSGTFPNGFYIFASPRNVETATSISATFTVASGNMAAVVGEGRSIPIIAGQFTDTFASGMTVHIYQVS